MQHNNMDYSQEFLQIILAIAFITSMIWQITIQFIIQDEIYASTTK